MLDCVGLRILATYNIMGIKIGTQALHLTIAKMMTLLITMVSGMLLAHFRTLAEYGTYSQMNIVITLAASLLMLGLPNSINYFLARAEDERERSSFLSNYYTLSTILCVVIGCALLVCIPFIEKYFDNKAIGDFYYYLLIFPWTSVTIGSISNVLVVYDKTKFLMLINIISSLVSLSAVLLVQLFELEFKYYIIFLLVGNSAIALWVYAIVYRIENGITIKLDKQTIKKVFIYSIPLGLATLVGTIDVELDKLVIGGLANTDAVAIYANAGKELPLTIVASSLTAVLLPQLAKLLKCGCYQKAVDLWKVSIEISYMIICFFVAACIAFAPQIVTFLYSSKYLPGVNVFRIYAIVLLFRVTYWGIILNSIGKTKYILYASIGALILNIVLNILFYYWIGFNGPALATLMSMGIVSMIQLKQTSTIVDVKMTKIWPWDNILKISIVNAVWASMAFGVIRFFDIGIDSRSIIITIIFGLVITLVYFFAVKKKIICLWKELNSCLEEE